MHRNAQLDRRKTTSSSLRQSSTLSSSAAATAATAAEDVVVPVIDVYTVSDATDDEKKSRTTITTRLWRSLVSLHPLLARSRRPLPRYDVHTDEAQQSNPQQQETVASPLFALTTQRQTSLDSSEDSLDCDDISEDVENNTKGAAEEVWLYEQGSSEPRHAWILRRKQSTFQEVDVQSYMARREMSALQEKWNALTMIPHPLLCAYYVFSCVWIPRAMVHALQEQVQTTAAAGADDWPQTWMRQPSDCWATPTSATTMWSLFSLPSMPPAPVLAMAAGVTLHAPWSMLYHWKYAHSLPPGAPRTNHWSRRMDQAMLHVASALISYATSGSWDYMMATTLFNADSAYRHFTPKVSPRRNKVRITLAMIAYSLPVLRQGHQDLFLQFWVGMSIAMWLFATYPIGGWSHAVFHVVTVFSLIPLFEAAALTGAAQESVQMAAQCTVWQQAQQQQQQHTPSVLL